MIIPNMVKAFGSQSIEFQLHFQSDVRLRITKSHVKALDQPSQPCTKDTKNLNTSACIAKFIEDQMGCGIRLLGNDIGKKPTCSSGSQLRNLSKIFEALKHADDKFIYEQTGCMASCEKYEYQGFEYHRNDVLWLPCRGDEPCNLSLRPEINDRSYDEKRQYVVYDFNSFIADVGGFIGLLLGFSTLSLFKELEKLLRSKRIGSIWKMY